MSYLAATAADQVDDGFARPIGRRELFLWLACGLFANEAIQVLDFSSPAAFASGLATQNFIAWFAYYVVIYRLNASARRAPARLLDWCFAAAVLSGILLSSFLAYRFAIGTLATVMALYLMLFYRADAELKSASVVLAALSAHLVWGPILFQLLTPQFLRGDAFLVGSILSFVQPGVVWNDTTFYAPDGDAISLVGACSSFQNLSTAILASVAVAMFARTWWTRRALAALAIACVAMILMNDARLCLLAVSRQAYEFWHQGAGAPLIGYAMTAVLALIALWGVKPARRPA
jgi:exosortase/archaeosortase family protein